MAKYRRRKNQIGFGGLSWPQAEIAFLFFRAIMPIVFLSLALFYLFVIDDSDWPIALKIGIAVAAAYVGIKSPEFFLSSTISKRRTSMRMAFPDALDLMLICVESGMSIEHAFRKVGQRNWRAIGSARRRVRLGDCRTLLSSRETIRLFESCGANGPRLGKANRHSAHPGGEIRHSARSGSTHYGAGKPRYAHDWKPSVRRRRCRQS